MRKLKMKKATTKPIRRKCHSCGKMATNPYVYHVVPAFSYGVEIPVYQKSAPKTNRLELRGNKKVLVYNYCNNWILKDEEDSSGDKTKYNVCYIDNPPSLHRI
jgi:hypothetical protein